MVAEESPYSNPSIIQLLKEATESHVSQYLNNAYTDHECFSLVVPNDTMYVTMKCFIYFYLIIRFSLIS